MNIVDFSFNPETRYTFWSGITGGFFLALSYFGTDQSQVGRYLTGKSIRESQMGLIMNGLLKVPMQFFILLTGVMVFVFFQFHSSPLHFNPTNNKLVKNSSHKAEYEQLEKQLEAVQAEKKEISMLYVGQLNQDYDNPILQQKMVFGSPERKKTYANRPKTSYTKSIRKQKPTIKTMSSCISS